MVQASKQRPISRDTSAFFPVISPPENRAVSSVFREETPFSRNISFDSERNIIFAGSIARYVQPTFKHRVQCRNRVLACYPGGGSVPFFRNSLRKKAWTRRDSGQIEPRASRGTRHFPRQISNSRVSAQVTDSSVVGYRLPEDYSLSPSRQWRLLYLGRCERDLVASLNFLDAVKDVSKGIFVRIRSSFVALYSTRTFVCFVNSSSVRCIRVIYLYI